MNDCNEYDKVSIAIEQGNIETLKTIYKDEYLNMKDESGSSLLLLASMNGKIEILRFLLDKNWDIECEDKVEKCRPIHYATMSGHIDIVKELIGRNCLVDPTDADGDTPYDIALRFKKSDCAQLLREIIPEMNKPKPIDTPVKAPPKPSLTNYTKQTILGKGGFGKVFQCVDEQSHQCFAVKEVLSTSSSALSKERKALEKEIDIFTKLNRYHPNIVQYYGHQKDEHVIYVFMECLSGGSIADYLRTHGAMTPKTIAPYVTQILLGLRYLHGNDIIHRDIKGANIIIDGKDHVKLCDFGVSVYVTDKKKQHSQYIANHHLFDDSLLHDLIRSSPLPRNVTIQHMQNVLKSIVSSLQRTSTPDQGIAAGNSEHPVEEVRVCYTANAPTIKNLENLENDLIKQMGCLSNRIEEHHLQGGEYPQVLHFDIDDNLETMDLTSINGYDTRACRTRCGTPYWMAPEVISKEPYSTKADIWSLGATVIEMLTAKHPYPDDFPASAAYQIRTSKKIKYNSPEIVPFRLQVFLKQLLTPLPQKRASAETLLKSEFLHYLQ